MVEQIDRLMNGKMGGRVDRCGYGWMDLKWRAYCIFGQIDGRVNGKVDEWMNL